MQNTSHVPAGTLCAGSKRLPDLAFEIRRESTTRARKMTAIMPQDFCWLCMVLDQSVPAGTLRMLYRETAQGNRRRNCGTLGVYVPAGTLLASFSTYLADVEWRNVPAGTLVKTVERRGWILVFVKVFLQEHFRMIPCSFQTYRCFPTLSAGLGNFLHFSLWSSYSGAGSRNYVPYIVHLIINLVHPGPGRSARSLRSTAGWRAQGRRYGVGGWHVPGRVGMRR